MQYLEHLGERLTGYVEKAEPQDQEEEVVDRRYLENSEYDEIIQKSNLYPDLSKNPEKNTEDKKKNKKKYHTIYEDYVTNATWYSDEPREVYDFHVPSFWKRWWLYPFREISQAISHLEEYPTSSVFLLVIFTCFMWVLVGIVSSIGTVLLTIRSILSMFPFLAVFLPGSAVNWGTIDGLKNWKFEEHGDLKSPKWDLDNCKFFIRACAFVYENPERDHYKRIVHNWKQEKDGESKKSWKFLNTRTAARESAHANIWNFKEDDSGYIVLVFKGTSPFNWNEWLTDATVNPRKPKKISNVEYSTVHQGFYESLWSKKSNHWDHIVQQINSACDDFRKDHNVKNIYIWVTGHSLGAAVATLATCRLLLHPEDITDTRAKLVGSYTFGTPRVANNVLIKEVNRKLKEDNCSMHRVVNANDIITMIPCEDPETYSHFGDSHYLSVLGEIEHYGTKEKETTKEFFVRVGQNFGQTFIDRFRKLVSLPVDLTFVKLFNTTQRLFVPPFVYDHFPSQYMEHLGIKEEKIDEDD